MRTSQSFVASALLSFFSATASAQTGAPKCPNVLIVFDVSGSMNMQVSSNGPTKYPVARTAIATLVGGAGDKFRYGLELFGLGGTSGCLISDPVCSYPNPTTACRSVTCGFGTAQSINDVLNVQAPEGATPTALAMTTAMTRTDMKDTSRPRYVMLVTDGDPNCATTIDAVTASVDAISAARDGGVKTFVLGFAGGSTGNLMRMAIAGGVQKQGCDAGSPTSCYYVANNATELQAALDAISQVVAGELGPSGGCDETCYAQGCPSGQMCMNKACVADPCSGVQCASGQACVNGACNTFCTTTCATGKYCNSAGQCVDEIPCNGGCDTAGKRNQVCVNGACVEDYCSGATGNLKCPSGTVCKRNNCIPTSSSPDGGPGTGTGDEPSPGCCSGAPGAFSILALMVGLAALAARRRFRT